MIEAIGLCKSFGAHVALTDVSFRVEPGEVVGFLGPNGAGKSTTLRILTGFLPPTSGRALIGGHDLGTHGAEGRRMVGYMPERIPFYGDMKVEGYLRYVAELKGVPRRASIAEVGRVLEWSGARAVRGRLLSRISHGFRQRVGIAQALIGKPAALLLDEPTGGLDPEQAADFREMIGSLEGGCAVLLSTHILPEAARICGRVIILDRGRVLAVDKPENLGEGADGKGRFHLKVRGDLEAIIHSIDRVPACRAGVPGRGEGGIVSLEVEYDGEDEAASDIARAVLDAGGELLEISRRSPSLEDVFLRLTRDGQ